MRDLTSYAYSFESLIRGNFLYVDKTEYIWALIRPATAGYFLARPRRFGKSLTVSTLKAVFEGKKELFKRLAIYDKPYDWKPYPVILLDMGNCSAQTPKELKLYLARLLESQCREHQVKVKIQQEALSASFEDFIGAVAGKGQVVLLLDEYDKPILNTLATPEAAACRDVLKGFYSTIKKCGSKERFVFVTGVSKFCHVSLFSDLNNLTDITMDARYATMFGYTQAELEKYFADRIELACEQLGKPREKLLKELSKWYDGYRFHAEAESVYNPVSLAQFFLNGAEFNNYWFDTGTPAFLIELIKKEQFNLDNVLSRPVSGMAFKAFEVDRMDPLSLLLQTGYLTIKSSIKKGDQPWYRLNFPNREVSVSFDTCFLASCTGKSDEFTTNFCELLADSMKKGDIGQLRTALETFFAGISYEVHHKDESNFQNIFFTIFRLLGYNIKAESHTSCDRIDAVAQTRKWIYLFEFKLDKDDSALEQIREKEYFKPFLLSPRRIMLIGVNFDTKTGKLSNWKNEELVRNRA